MQARQKRLQIRPPPPLTVFSIDVINVPWGEGLLPWLWLWLWLPALPYRCPTGPLQVPYRTALEPEPEPAAGPLMASELLLGESRDRGAAK